ncbi:ribonuclease catalytic domain-containing protein [Inhella gelatinilytica]|uniref:RNB domain-containing ribonuclease n=1 Tax=Inhella gelatinilytica TaxID=2795030 RepID=A0A931NF71_9BURK|nr:RNB domain-containing ribonuclease [Inhella gelatinilytica]MBH9553221.1 RNB domain-containing ribonuclease [Inhella gelatinilytica]
MFVMFDDSGKAQAGRILSEAESSLQVELDSGKRVKIKGAQALLQFEKPLPGELLSTAQSLAAEMDLDLAWEFAPDGEFGFADLAADYFSDKPSVTERAAAWLALTGAPHYFRRAGKGGNFKKAPQEQVQAALLAIERKKQQQAQIEAWASELAEGRCPDAITAQIYKLLFKPDKNGPEYKALVQAALLTKKAPLDLLTAAGAIGSPYQFHWQRFLFEQFPKGTGFPALEAPAIGALPRATVAAFSIDDSSTTEIDDALSVQGLGSGTVTFGIHIAAPALAIQPEGALDQIARNRLSTVYMPGWKVTMLPDEVVQTYTLTEGRDCPALSLYCQFNESTLELIGSETRIEAVPIAANLRHDKLDGVITEASLAGEAPADYAFAAELAFAHRLARHLKLGREQVRGKPESFNRPDYSFKLEGERLEPPRGDETVWIGQRARGTALDLIVAEAMILANSRWGAWLAEMGLPGLYRSQAGLAPGIKVRMGIKPLPHAGMGVACYAWCTSPLRRYVDLVNQWQLIAAVRHGQTAPLVAPFKPKDANLFAILSSFDAAYSAYNGFQTQIERYWTLVYLQQQGLLELTASVMRDGLVRADTLPLVFKALGCETLERGSAVRVRITGIDLLTLELHASLTERLTASAAEGDESDTDDEEESLQNATSLTIAVDLSDAEAPPPP